MNRIIITEEGQILKEFILRKENSFLWLYVFNPCKIFRNSGRKARWEQI